MASKSPCLRVPVSPRQPHPPTIGYALSRTPKPVAEKRKRAIASGSKPLLGRFES